MLTIIYNWLLCEDKCTIYGKKQNKQLYAYEIKINK